MIIGKKGLPQFKSPASFTLFQSDVEGDCKACNGFAELDKFGYCLDEDCRHTRKVRALINGTAQMLPNGQFVWRVE